LILQVFLTGLVGLVVFPILSVFEMLISGESATFSFLTFASFITVLVCAVKLIWGI